MEIGQIVDAWVLTTHPGACLVEAKAKWVGGEMPWRTGPRDGSSGMVHYDLESSVYLTMEAAAAAQIAKLQALNTLNNKAIAKLQEQPAMCITRGSCL